MIFLSNAFSVLCPVIGSWVPCHAGSGPSGTRAASSAHHAMLRAATQNNTEGFPTWKSQGPGQAAAAELGREALIAGQGSSPPVVPSAGAQHIKGQRGVTPAERSKAPCHQRLQQAPRKLPRGREAPSGSKELWGRSRLKEKNREECPGRGVERQRWESQAGGWQRASESMSCASAAMRYQATGLCL